MLATPDRDGHRFRKLRRIIYPAPTSLRRDCLTTSLGSLGGRTPRQAIQSDDKYHLLLTATKSWAAQWWRTTVEIFVGAGADSRPRSTALVCICTVDTDPRIDVWRRAAEALNCSPNIRADGPYPQLNAVRVIVTKVASGSLKPALGVRLDVTVSGDLCYATAWISDTESRRLGPV